ncbi:hypothetical protein BJ508DRAFT_410864 [Ascobolus immersus RN42]|uniref:Uncharacterized protein n=1 Tax=Ascobolus immersus RN42 TaxID=1160509 RepID=A0A3N4IPL0_ASCIM|nr:hypothetical protein BJ508DRAFT_410864 [Ascobolus immersus RN42]
MRSFKRGFGEGTTSFSRTELSAQPSCSTFTSVDSINNVRNAGEKNDPNFSITELQSNSEIRLENGPQSTSESDSGDDGFPSLPYTLETRKMSIAIVWSVILLDSCILPLVLFYILRFGAKMDDQKSIAVTSAVFGFFSMLQWVYRMWMLLRKGSNNRPLSSTSPDGMTPRWMLDFYQWQFSFGFVGITVLFVYATKPPPNFVLLSLPPSVLLAQIGPQFLVSAFCSYMKFKSPMRFSSSERGEIAIPAVFTCMEDIVAVEGGAGIAFRRAVKRRYQQSPRFRKHMLDMTVMWGAGATICSAVTISIALTVPKYVAYCLGWTLPYVWGGCFAYITMVKTSRMLKLERKDWDDGIWGERRIPGRESS